MTGPRNVPSWPFLATSAAILAATLLAVPLQRVAEALGWIGVWPTALAVFVAVVDGTLVDSDRLRRLCRHLGLDMTLRDAAALAIPSNALGVVAPLQANDVLKARQLNVLHGRPFGEAMGIVATDRGFSLVAHAALLAGGLAGLGCDGNPLIVTVAVLLGISVSGAISLALARLVAGRCRIPGHPWLGAFVGPFCDLAPGFVVAMSVYAVVADLAVVVTLHVMAMAAGIEIPFVATLVLRHGSLLVSKVPITVGGYGLREGSLALGLAAFGEAPVAVAVALWFGVCTSLVPSLVALTFRPFVAGTVERLREDLSHGVRQIAARVRSAAKDGPHPGSSDDLNRPR